MKKLTDNQVIIESIAKGIIEGISLFEEDIMHTNAFNSVLEESKMTAEDYLVTLIEEEETNSSSKEESVVEESKEEKVEESRLEESESIDDFDAALNKLLSELVEK